MGMTITKVLPIFILSFISVVEPKAQSIYPFEAEARLITEPIVNGAVALEDFIGDIVSPLLQPQFSGDKGNQQAYDAAPKPVKIPCGDYGSKRKMTVVYIKKLTNLLMPRRHVNTSTKQS